MKTIRLLPNAIASLCAVLVQFLELPRVQAANANPPGKLTYQGFLTDQNGTPYGSSNPVNETVIFRIYTASTGGTLKWAEQQTVTIDKGHFSVLLGEGSASGSEPRTADLTSVFAGTDASDRFLQLTVAGATILPRIQYFPNPYAMLAMNARGLVDPNGNTILSTAASAVGINKTAPTSALDVAGTITGTGLTINGAATLSGAITGSSFTGSGAALTALNASQLTTGVLADARLSGTYSGDLTLNNAGNTFYGNGANVTALSANNLASGTVADARLSAYVTNAVKGAAEATPSKTNDKIVKRDSAGGITVGALTADSVTVTGGGDIDTDGLRARWITVTEGVNEILPPAVFYVGTVGNTLNWHSTIIPSATVQKYLAGVRGGRMKIILNRQSDDYVRTIEYQISMETPGRSAEKSTGLHVDARAGDGNTSTIIQAGTKVEILSPWNWIYVRNYHSSYTAPTTEGAAYSDYTLELLTPADWCATVILYNF